MDTSIEYINMCKAAKEIQALETTQRHPCIANLFSKPTNVVVMFPEETWLPRQDQLQDIYIKESMQRGNDWTKYSVTIVYNRIGKDNYKMEIICDDPAYLPSCGSLEQWWLSAIMKTIYKKTWNSEAGEWITIKQFEDSITEQNEEVEY